MKRKIYENKLLMEQFTSTITKKPESWEIATLGDYLELLTDYHANGSYEILKANVKLLYEEDYAVMIRTTNFEQSNFEDLVYINKKAYDFLSKSKVFTGDILMNKIANAGAVYTMPDLKKPVSLGMNLFLLRFDKKYCDHYYIYSYLNYPPIRYLISNMTRGASTRTITKDMVRNIPLVLPPLSEQKKIASVLSAYDNLIELNERRIKVLEEMARLIFKEWFVKFKFPGYEKIKMVDSELGPIPQGWQVKKLSEIMDFVKGSEPGSKNYFEQKSPNSIRFIRVGDLERSSKDFIYIDKDISKIEVVQNDVLISLDGTVGKVDYGMSGAIASGIRKCFSKIGKMYQYQLLKSAQLQGFLRGVSSGGTVLAHAGNHIKNYLLATSKDLWLEIKYSELCDPLFKQCVNLNQQNKVFRQTCNMLLPKLISGEIDVSDLDIKINQNA